MENWQRELVERLEANPLTEGQQDARLSLLRNLEMQGLSEILSEQEQKEVLALPASEWNPTLRAKLEAYMGSVTEADAQA